MALSIFRNSKNEIFDNCTIEEKRGERYRRVALYILYYRKVVSYKMCIEMKKKRIVEIAAYHNNIIILYNVHTHAKHDIADMITSTTSRDVILYIAVVCERIYCNNKNNNKI